MSVLRLTVAAIFLAAISAEWIEITRNPKPSNVTKFTAIAPQQRADAFYNREAGPSTPSPEWVEYQRERFSDKRKTHSQQLIVNAEQHLKNSAKVIVPANVQQMPEPLNNSSPALRNKIVQVKTRIDVTKYESGQTVMDKIETQLGDDDMETTPRRVMSYDDGEDAENEENPADADEEEEEAAASKPSYTDDGTAADDATNANDNGVEYPSVKGFFKFLRTIQKNWLKKSGFSIEQKINSLKQLRDKLMRTIENQFTTLWQPKERLRRKRGILDESNLNFPPEAALMSINFLTFAVFLIKLVLQVVHIIKSKHYSFSGFGINAEPVGKTTLRN